jgi:hypothetical protein
MKRKTTVNIPTLVLVGGFLGAGKTTLLLAAVQELNKLNLRSALIINDQGDSLVDAEFAALHGAVHRAVTGGCFCCRFSSLEAMLKDLREFSPDVIFAEPVGSCADISATILQPLRTYAEYALAPFTVLVDPERAFELLGKDADQNLRYLFTKQLEEADIICFTKSDIHSHYPDLSDLADTENVRQLSASSGQGVAAWLDEVFSGTIMSGGRILDIDYQRYARAEAALVWLNLRLDLKVQPAMTPAGLLGPFFDELQHQLMGAGFSVTHMKAIMQCSTGFVKAAVTKNTDVPKIEGNLDASPSSDHRLLLNLRGLGRALDIRNMVEENVKRLDAQKLDMELNCFHPAAPRPQHRFLAVSTK